MTDDNNAVIRDRLAAENARLRQECAELRVCLMSLVEAPLRYNDKRLEIDCFSHEDAMERVRLARAALAKVRT